MEVAGRDPRNPGPVTQLGQARAASSRNKQLPGNVEKTCEQRARAVFPLLPYTPGATSCLQFRRSKEGVLRLPEKPSAVSGDNYRTGAEVCNAVSKWEVLSILQCTGRPHIKGTCGPKHHQYSD